MGTVTICEDALRAKHIDDPELRRVVLDLSPGEPVTLVVADHPIVFRKPRSSPEDQPDPGLRPDGDDTLGAAVWGALQAKRGESVRISLAGSKPAVDPYLAYLDELFWEWRTPEDAAAFDDL